MPNVKAILGRALSLRPRVPADELRRAIQRAVERGQPLYLETGFCGGAGRCVSPIDEEDQAEMERLTASSTRWYRLL